MTMEPPMTPEQEAKLDRIEAKLDTLIAALAEYAEDEEGAPAVDLSGNPCGGDRDQSQSLG
jgi:hypothetical protein